MQSSEIERALGYPYRRPVSSYLFSGGIAKDLPDGIDLSNRRPVLACGSNGAPEQLLRKYGSNDDIAIPVTAAKMYDIGCTYSAHFSAYGAIAAALCVVPGIESQVHITWLTDAELDRMHETEAIGLNYHFTSIEGINVVCDQTGPLHSLNAYVSLRGSLLLDGDPIILKGIPANNTVLRKLDQKAMQEEVRHRLAPETLLADFIMENINDATTRQSRTGIISQFTRPFIHSGMTVMFP
jgi:hypothetical protein